MNNDQKEFVMDRRRKVKEMLDEGWSQRAIADELRISRSTVKRDLDYLAKQTENIDRIHPHLVGILEAATVSIVEKIKALPELNNAFPDISSSGLILVDVDNDQKKLMYNPEAGFLGIRIGLDLQLKDALSE